MKDIILFDGVCNLCTRSVQFIIKRDQGGKFQFASRQSDIGQTLMAQYQLKKETKLADADTLILIQADRAYTHSEAALRIAMGLDGAWRLLGILRFVPRFIRDWAYRLVAQNRYRWFGQADACWIPTPELRKRFIDVA